MPDLPIVAPGYGEELFPETEDLSGILSNRCVVDRAVLTEAIRAAMNRPFLKVLRWVEILLCALCLGLMVKAIQGGESRLAVWCGSVAVMIGFFYLQQFVRYPKKAVKNQLTRVAVDEGTLAPEDTLWFKDENVARRRGEQGEILHMPYGNIRRVFETRRLFVITTKHNRLIPLDKKGFADGTAEDFCRLIAEKTGKAVRRDPKL